MCIEKQDVLYQMDEEFQIAQEFTCGMKPKVETSDFKVHRSEFKLQLAR
jgi:hypothetical protein